MTSKGMTMVESMALGMQRSFANRIAASAGKSFDETGVSLPDVTIFRAYAIAALKTMEEPTEAMRLDGEQAYYEDGMAPAIWSAMIRAAIQEAQQEETG